MNSFNYLFIGIHLHDLLPSPFTKLFSQFYLAKQFGGSKAELSIFATYISCIILSQTETFSLIGYQDELQNLDAYFTAYIVSTMVDQDLIAYYKSLIESKFILFCKSKTAK